MRIYETMLIVKPDIAEEERENIINNLVEFLTEKLGAQVDKVDRMGIKKTAYPLKKYNEADYTVIYFKCSGENLSELEQYFKVRPEFLRWQTFRREDLEKEEKKQAKKEEVSENTEKVEE
ncbi:30S ribosomal protein S6 [Thermosipho atlanticus]|uniref:Small ribosomal subunit protein bS6 n=1 Tax=Thermosipho atlanticus DSM 15807 TaxID=1123380 RepID=A0A1M5TZX7_9BACT|nr:30S ribosomal protein S6 [Thermosipho atlanticus]SHH56385.1 SSU ribosomal protein S6P [Thermosipho atlanticus DSM 15807]